MSRKKELIFLFIILIIAGFFRLWQLDKIPPWLFPDVAMNGNDAWETLKNVNFKVFYPENNGREGLMIWLIVFSFLIFGVSVWSIKIVAAIFGTLTVLGLYLLTKELFNNNQNNRAIALLSSFFLAISFWHTNFSRLGFRAILLPFVLVFSFYFLFKGFNSLQKNNQHFYQTSLKFLGAGLFFGLGFYTYTSFRMAVLILPFIFIPYWFVSKKENLQKEFFLHTFSFLLIVFIVALPLGIYFLSHPQDFIGRATPISIFAKENPLKEFAKSLILHLAMFNVYGDPNFRHNLAGSPMIFWPIGILFLFGLFYATYQLIKNFKIQQINILNFWLFLFLISWWFIMLLPGILTYEGIPHALRTIGVIPPVFILSGLAGYKIYQLFNQNTINKKLLIFTCFLFLASLLFSEYNKYFNLWAKNEKIDEAFGKKYAQIGYFLNSLPDGAKKYVIIDTPNNPLYGISIDAQTPIFIERTKFKDKRAEYINFRDLEKIDLSQRIDLSQKEIIILPLYEDNIFQELFSKFPQGQIKIENNLKYYYLTK